MSLHKPKYQFIQHYVKIFNFMLSEKLSALGADDLLPDSEGWEFVSRSWTLFQSGTRFGTLSRE